MLFKFRSINELLRFSGNRRLGGEGKKCFGLEKIYISKKQTELNELRQTVLSCLDIFFSFRTNFLFFIIFIYFCSRLFQVRTCVLRAHLTTPLLIMSSCSSFTFVVSPQLGLQNSRFFSQNQ